MMDNLPGSGRSCEREEAAVYIADLVHDLAAIARRHRMDVLGYLLDIAKLEAESTSRRDVIQMSKLSPK